MTARRAAGVTGVWVLAAAACAGLGAAALHHPAPSHPASLTSGPLFSQRPGIYAVVPAGAPRVTVTLSDAGCLVSPGTVAPGPTTFVVVNPGDTFAEEVELRYGAGTRILAEAEDVDPGASQLFSSILEEGRYAVSCPGTAGPPTILTVLAPAAG